MAKTESEKITKLEDGDDADEKAALKKVEHTKLTPWYFQTFQLNPISIVLTMNMDGVDREDLNRLVGFGRAFCNIDGASFTLSGLLSENMCVTADEIVSRLSTHYTRAAMTQVAKFIFGADILGSPISLVSNIGTGVKDFITEPAQGFTRSPAEFGAGLARGTTSLVKNATVGVFNTTSKFTGAVASGAAALSFDEKYQLERDKARVREKPKHAGEGLRFGAKAFGKGLFSGLTGIVSSPIQGAVEDGFSGAVKGLARGAAGAVIKPTVGAIDSISRVTEGIKNTATLWDEEKKHRTRLPRFIGPDKSIQAYNEADAQGQQLLRSIENGRFSQEWFHSQDCVKDGILLTSNLHLLLLNDTNKIEWAAPISIIRGLQQTEKYIIVYLKVKNKAKMLQKSTSEKIIFPSERKNARSVAIIYSDLVRFVELLHKDRRLQQL